MLELSKNILRKVSFDHALFYKELKKALSWIQNQEDLKMLRDWCIQEFGQTHRFVLQEVFVDYRR